MPNEVTVVCLHESSESSCHKALLVGLQCVFKLVCHDFQLVVFDVSFKYQIKHQIWPTRIVRNGGTFIRFKIKKCDSHTKNLTFKN